MQHTVKTVTTIAADGTQTVAKTIEDAGPQYGSVGELLTTQFRTKLDEGWAQIQSDIQTDALGAIEALATALKDGDLESLGLWAASYFWQACTKEQQTQIQAVAMGALNQLSSALSGVFGNLSQMAMGLVAQFVPAAASATTSQIALNTAMDANPILFVISLIGMLVGALLSFSGKNADVANAFQNVWAGVEDFMSYIFEGLMRIVAAGIEGFVILINGLIGLYNSVAWLWGDHVDYISNPAWNFANQIAADRKARQEARKKQQEAINNPSSSGTSGTSASSQKVIESMTDTSKTTNADGSTVTTKVLTEFAELRQELEKPQFRYVVPDFRLNPALEQLRTLPPEQKAKVEFLCNECCWFGCTERKRCYETVSRQNLGEDCPDHRCAAPDAAEGYRFSKAMRSPGFIGVEDIRQRYLPAGFSHFKIEGRGLGSALVLEFLLYYMTKPEYQLQVRETIYLDNMLDLF